MSFLTIQYGSGIVYKKIEILETDITYNNLKERICDSKISRRYGRKTKKMRIKLSKSDWSNIGKKFGWWKYSAWDPVSDGKYRDGNMEWNVSSIIRHAEDLPSVMMDVEALIKTNRTTETKEGMLGDLIENPSDIWMRVN